MRTRIARLFTIKTRWEACFLIYAIALGAIERGRLYVEAHPGIGGWLLFTACMGVVFVAGAKLFDSVRPAEPRTVGASLRPAPRRGAGVSRSRPRLHRSPSRGSGLPTSLRTD